MSLDTIIVAVLSLLGTLTGEFETYGGTTGNTLRHRRRGGVMHVKGVVTPKAAARTVCLCTVTAAGLVHFARYRLGNTWSDAAANTWLPIDISFILG